MTEVEPFLPNWASPPGETVADILEERGILLSDFAREMDWTDEQVNGLIRGSVRIDRVTASLLTKILGAPQSFWLIRQQQYQDDLVRLKKSDSTAREVSWMRSLPIKNMTDWGWILADTSDRVAACLQFFGASDIDNWHAQYDGVLQSAAFRSTQAFTSDPPAVAAWLRKGELDANNIQCEEWNAERFRQILAKIRSLTRKHNPEFFIPELQRLCSECGVAVVVVPAPKGCRASGATRFLSPQKALVQLSFRYLSDDHFWFTFFHEAGHLLLHDSNALFLEGKGMTTTEEEEEADRFSEGILIPSDQRASLLGLPANKRSVIIFAHKLGISPGIVVGQLQHHGIIARDKLNFLKRRYRWT